MIRACLSFGSGYTNCHCPYSEGFGAGLNHRINNFSEFKVYADEPSIIYEFSMADCPSGVLPDDFGEMCMAWLSREYPKCTFAYESECGTLFLDGGHGLSEPEIHLVQNKAQAFVRGLMHGVVMARRPKGRPPASQTG